MIMLSYYRGRFLRIALASLAFATSSSSAASLVSPTAPVVVAGAGPASLVFVSRYLQLNPTGNIVLYEKRPRPPTYSQSADDNGTGFGAFGFGLGGRAQGLLARVPGLLERVKSVAFVFAGGMLWFVNRRDLCAEMICNLEKEHGGLNGKRLKVVFESQVSGVNDDFTVNVTTSSESGKERQECVPYSLLVAGDGTNSVIRQSLVDSKEISCKRYLRNIGWKALLLPRQSSLSPGFVGFSKKRTYGVTLPRFKDRSVVLMRWPKGKTYGQKNPFGANSPEKLKAELKEVIPNITVFPSDTVLQEFLDERTGKETFLKLNKHASPDRRIALLGDAAVGMYFFLGQGVASAMERANLLAEAVCSVDNDQMVGFSEALRSFSDESVREGHAITDLNLLDHAKSMPLIGRFVPNPTQLPSLQDPDVPYSDIRKQHQGWVRFSSLLWFFARVPMSD